MNTDLACIYSLKQYITSIDWTQFIPDLFATIIGFGLAIWGARIADHIKESSDASEVKKLIKSELENVIVDLKCFDINSLDVQPLKTPSWDSALYTGQITILNFKLREQLFKVYSIIKEFNSWCMIHTNYYFEKGQQNRLLIEELNRIKNELLNTNKDNKISTISTTLELLKERGRK